MTGRPARTATCPLLLAPLLLAACSSSSAPATAPHDAGSDGHRNVDGGLHGTGSGSGSSGRVDSGGPQRSDARGGSGSGTSSGSGSGGGAQTDAANGCSAEAGTWPGIGHVIIGTNDGDGWGPAGVNPVSATLIDGGIDWDRGSLSVDAAIYTPGTSTTPAGFHVIGLVGNLDDSALLSSMTPAAWAAWVVAQLQANPGIELAEAGNEMYYKGGVYNPQQYGAMYLAGLKAIRAACISTPLLFNMFGDYLPAGSSSWSQDANGGGWLRAAIAANPGLAEAIVANGISAHPYGPLYYIPGGDSSGVPVIASWETLMQSVLGSIPPIYITEFGYDIDPVGSCTQDGGIGGINPNDLSGVCSQEAQADSMRVAYTVWRADPHVQGIWWYQTEDTPGSGGDTGDWGVINRDGTTRPSFTVLSAFAKDAGG
jgi:hypothetical protein